MRSTKGSVALLLAIGVGGFMLFMLYTWLRWTIVWAMELDSGTPDLGSTWVIWPHSGSSSGLRSAAEARSSLQSSSQPA